MRIYTTCHQAVNEVQRDLWELSIENHPETMQDKYVGDDPDYKTRELSPYAFQITQPTGDYYQFLEHFNKMEKSITKEELQKRFDWIVQELDDRVNPNYLNPGNAWEYRKGVWEEFVHNGRFAYSYNERIRQQLQRIIEELKEKPSTRQATIGIHNYTMDLGNLGGKARIPCSMYYQFLIRNERLNIIYTMRSSDFLTHFCYDNILAIKLMEYIAGQIGVKPGKYTFFTGSLHAYEKDLKSLKIF